MSSVTAVGSIALTIDGQTVRGEPGETVLQVARRNGIYIPTLCQHDSLESEARCRLCLVEVKGARGYETACTTKIADGMEVVTDSPEIEKLRRVTVELLIADHPTDCLSCGQNLNCELQKVAQYLGVDRVRYRRTTQELPLDESNPFFIRDPNKCVLCGRCVQTCQQLQGIGAIDFMSRGYATAVGTFSDLPLVDSPCQSCGECVVRCPTGALSKREHRPATRKVKTTCTFCGVGCSLFLGVRGGQIVSADGDPESPANRGALCVKGRFGNGFVNSPDRLTKPLIKRNGVFEEASWDEALGLVAEKFAQFRGDRFAAIGSSRCTNEECYLVQKFARAVMGTNNVDNCARLCHSPTVTGLSQAFGMGGGTNPLSDIDNVACLFIIGSNPTHAHPVAGAVMRRAVRHAKLIVADPRHTEICNQADIWLPLRPGTDVALLMGMARVILDEGLHDAQFIAERCEGFEEFKEQVAEYDLDWVAETTGIPKETIIEAARTYATTKPGIIVWSLGITEHSHGSDNVLGVANLALLTGNIGKPSAGCMPMRGQNNVQGACDMGCGPTSYHGYQSVAKPEVRHKFEQGWGVPLPEKPGLTLVEFFQAAERGEVEALYMVGMDPAFSVADVTRVQGAMRKMKFIVAQDIFLTGSAEFADVVLPAASFAEKDGTFTNLERRVQLIRPAIVPIGESKPDWWITCEIARRMGAKGFDFTSASEVLDELASLSPSFAGLSFARLEEGGIQWPCPSPDHPGTPVLHVERFNTPSGKGHLSPLKYRPPAEAADRKYPFILITGRNIYHFHLAMTCRVPGLMELRPEEIVAMNPKDAEKLGVQDGGRVKVSSRRGALEVLARVTDEMKPGEVFMTFHFYDQPTNILTQQALDPAAKTPEYKVTAVRIDKVNDSTSCVA
jgi:formate dehydrogenase alpha subunit